ncbi:DUF2569 domain-containing protein [Affinibrenneria salicis]|uniref:DUF2569 domain-containing protein n=1 Tax=Affinibrenneria salicis TaxID=2590031 RepID=A0A5J5G4R1_9GAMM|nr:DUF2569 domain-containing protein [Affinibrenneria salicis]KAA9001855.1 DUF2569 domain-containing protein [Affinibrenneria salicis]
MSAPASSPPIGGWLLAPLAWLLVTLLSASLMLAFYLLTLITPEARQALFANGETFMLQWSLSLLTTAAIWLYSAWLVWLFFHRSRRFPRLFILWLILTVALALKTFAFSPVTDEAALRNLWLPLLAAAIFAPYISRSRRVKATFTVG